MIRKRNPSPSPSRNNTAARVSLSRKGGSGPLRSWRPKTVYAPTGLFAVLALSILFALSTPVTCSALSPWEILVIANRNAPKGVELARYYMKQRNIPEENLLLLKLTTDEKCSRKEYVDRVALPVRDHLNKRGGAQKIRCLVTLFGMPLKIAPPVHSVREKKRLDDLLNERNELRHKVKEQPTGNRSPEKSRLKSVTRRLNALRLGLDMEASLDSELSLVKRPDYSIKSWLPNPYCLSNEKRKSPLKKSDIIMTARLDAPSPELVKRIIDDSILAEKNGLKGTAYFDAKASDPGDKRLDPYKLYDRSIHLAAKDLKGRGVKVVVDETEALFAPGSAPSAALYCGWYSLARYVDAFTWNTGSVGYHIASAECTTLRKKGSRVWCKMMLEKGVAATIGPVGEPYVQAFPLPELFFQALKDGYLTLAECYFLSIPHVSWKMVLVGDPLYRPFYTSRQ